MNCISLDGNESIWSEEKLDISYFILKGEIPKKSFIY